MKILLVEDDQKVAKALVKGFQQEGFEIDVAADGNSGLVSALRGGADLVLLDVALPGANGWTILQALRAAGSHTPVLMLTARDGLDDKLKGLTLGADDYIVKPFALAELVARARAVLRRSGSISEESLVYADLVHDTVRGVTRRGDQRIELTKREASLLELLMRHKDEVLSRSYIANRIWEFEFDGDSNVIDTSVWRLRRKIDGNFERKLIHTVRGRGYVLR